MARLSLSLPGDAWGAAGPGARSHDRGGDRLGPRLYTRDWRSEIARGVLISNLQSQNNRIYRVVQSASALAHSRRNEHLEVGSCLGRAPAPGWPPGLGRQQLHVRAIAADQP